MSAHVLLILALVLTMAAFLLARAHRARLLDAELAAVLDRAVIDDVRDRVRRGPLPVLGTTGQDWRGCFLRLERADVCVRLRLYNPVKGRARLRRRAPVRLNGLTYVESLGWMVDVEDDAGARRHLGWFLEVEHPRQAA